MTNDNTLPQTGQDPEQTKLMQIYAAFTAGFVMNFIPSAIVQTFGFFLLAGVLIWAYALRGKSEENSLTHNHMVYVIRTIWISSLFLALGITAAVFLADHSEIHNVTNAIMSGMLMTEAQLNAIFTDYVRQNLGIFTLTLGPSILFLAYRLAKGLSRASKGYRIANPKTWI